GVFPQHFHCGGSLERGANWVFSQRKVLRANQRAKKQARESGRSRHQSSQVFLAGRCLSSALNTMDSAREATQGRLDAAGFWQVWQRFDADG
ncbi:unnamed protein product, partial [Gulo gulo]